VAEVTSGIGRFQRWWAQLRQPAVPVWHHAAYRLPLTSILGRTGLDPRRAELTLAWLRGAGVLRARDLRTPPRAPLSWLLMVHEAAWLEKLTEREELARIFSVEPWDMPVDEVLHTLRLSVGGTVAAARHAVRHKVATVNTMGGYHHAGRSTAGGFCAVNDIAVAVAVARKEGVTGTLAVLDLDAHPPDGTADCLQDMPHTWIGSLSGADWGPLPGEVDETVLPPGTGDADYLKALHALLDRMPPAPLTFVLAGGDVVADDPLGTLSLTEDGLRRRELAVRSALSGRGSVWLPGGGYGTQAWRRFALTLLALRLGERAPELPADADPFTDRLAAISASLRARDLGDEDEEWFTEADLPGFFGPPAETRLLGFYTRAGVELAIARYGLYDELRRLGYHQFEIELGRDAQGDQLRIFARARDAGGDVPSRRLLLFELVVERMSCTEAEPPVSGPGAPPPRMPVIDRDMLFVHWMTLRHPLAGFRADRPPLPGQEVPGLGLAREASLMLVQMARRLELSAVALRPAWFHVAHSARRVFHFADADRQGRFLALDRAMADTSLKTATHAVAQGRVLLNGAPYSWEPDLMLRLVDGPGPEDDESTEAVAEWRARAEAVAAATTVELLPAETAG
jgi:acetoin utilization deacetylase AcuC-like enzyme